VGDFLKRRVNVNQNTFYVKCVTQDEKRELTCWRIYEVRDIWRDEYLIFNGCWVAWYKQSLFIQVDENEVV
jgi:hypothetical protein